jgi:hypothetical protein
MNKKLEKIFALVLTWAGLFMVVLYSPMGSPDLYSKHKYFSEKRGVVFSNGKIENMPSMSKIACRSRGTATSQTTPFPTYESEKNNPTYAVASSEQFESKQKSEISVVLNQPEISQTKGNGGMVDEGSMGSVSIKKNSKKDVLIDNSLISLSSDLASLDNTIKNRQGVAYSPNYGGTSPGDDPIGNPIPVGDGWLYLLFLALGYGVRKSIRSKLS